MLTKLIGPAVTAGVLVLLAAGIAGATIPDGGGVIHACYKNSSGQLGVIDPGAGGSCKKNETSLAWGQTPSQGLQGPQGSQGSQGVQGIQGPTGPQGLAGVTQDPSTMIVVNSAAGDPQIGGFFKQVKCPQGTNVLWGSWEWSLFSGDMPPADIESFPSGDTAWDFAVGAGDDSKNASAFLIVGCAVVQ